MVQKNLISVSVRSRHCTGFTLVEILVATALFVSLVGLVAVSFSRLSNASDKALQILKLHTRADAIQRQLEQDLRVMMPVAALHIQTKTKPYTLTFMRQVKDLHPSLFRNTSLKSGVNPFEARYHSKHRISDTAWVRYVWGDGQLQRGVSRVNELTLSLIGNGEVDYNCNTEKYFWTPNFTTRPSTGVHANAITPMVQQHYDFFEGRGTINPVNSEGDCAAAATQKIAVYQAADNSITIANRHKPFDAAWNQQTPSFPAGDYRHLYTTLSTGNEIQLLDPDRADDGIPDDGQNDAYAVRNSDGQSVNKDRLNLLGSTDVFTDADGNEHQLYPSQIRPLFDGMEFIQFEFIGRDGDVLTAADETDRLGDGASSIDISGLDPTTGEGYENRPSRVRVTFLLHAIGSDELDDEDIDEDGDTMELLSQAMRERVESEGLATRLEKIAAFERYASRYRYSCVYIAQSIKIGQ